MDQNLKNRLWSQAGFTLIEILIAIVIISVIVSLAVLATGDLGQAKRIQSASEELDLLIGLAQQQAILQPSVLGLSIQREGYFFSRFVTDQKGFSGHWEALKNDQVLYYHVFPKNTQVILKPYDESSRLASPPGSEKPSIIISPNGNFTPFKIELGKFDSPPLYRISGKPNGELEYTEIK